MEEGSEKRRGNREKDEKKRQELRFRIEVGSRRRMKGKA